ncbi:thiamine-phosphate pyrophosphorylase [Methylohalomonas lacus]|uniref:Thiamine-phosphate synthase n=1 Tax=Methylohalomonas lacus TaxID=398773 RepID=A0AAE3HM32_9GAMM|nr:thiamine phosphate synthase [Methylohalomonas lacus]MCS3903457.1 thiamine-phosphate pyrophosphorylase [Methylohalomonas lacus]
MTPLPTGGLYAIADTGWIGAEHIIDAVSGVIDGGAVMVQLRDKQASVTGNAEKLDALLTLCRDRDVPFLINDDVALAVEIQADGVHVGQDVADPEALRARLGKQAIIGVSCHNDLDSARNALRQGADYVAFGRFYASQTKPDAPAATLATLRRARTELDLPIVAIGGITPDNVAELLAAGADFCAVIAGLFAYGHNTADTRATASRYQQAMQAYYQQQDS